MKKLKYFKNVTKSSADFYVYGEIVDEKEPDFWTGEISNTAVDPNDMKAELEELRNQGVRDFNIMINSPGGSVFAASTIVSLLKRFRTTNGVRIHAFIDGLCASAATYLAMVADDLNVYQNSIMMVHKPMTIAIGNADEMQKTIDTLNTIEDNTMLPMYLEKAKEGIDEKEMKNLVADETWFSGNPEDELYIGNFFNVNFLDQAKEVTACASPKLFKNYKHLPETLKNQAYEEETKSAETTEEISDVEEVAPVEKPGTTTGEETEESVDKPVDNLDYSQFENIINNIKC